MDLYWVQTFDHDEHWFMIADSRKEAARLHEDFEGYNRGEAAAEFVLSIPKNLDSEKGYPSNELLKACGAKFLSEGFTRIVEINDKKYTEGMLEAAVRKKDDDLFEARRNGRPNNTDPDSDSGISS